MRFFTGSEMAKIFNIDPSKIIVESIGTIAERVENVRELHKQIGDYCGYCADIGSCCNPKDFEYPCPTIRALDGEQ